MTSRLDENAGVLFDFAAAHRRGFTYEDVSRRLHWPYPAFMGAVRRVRRILGNEDQTLLCTPQGSGERWLYQLTSDPKVHRTWTRFRLKSIESSLETTERAATTIMRATDGRTVDGRKARLIERSVRHLREDLAAIREDQRLANGA